jgi:hypothetical protein
LSTRNVPPGEAAVPDIRSPTNNANNNRINRTINAPVIDIKQNNSGQKKRGDDEERFEWLPQMKPPRKNDILF